jgi:hypothetical protein
MAIVPTVLLEKYRQIVAENFLSYYDEIPPIGHKLLNANTTEEAIDALIDIFEKGTDSVWDRANQARVWDTSGLARFHTILLNIARYTEEFSRRDKPIAALHGSISALVSYVKYIRIPALKGNMSDEDYLYFKYRDRDVQKALISDKRDWLSMFNKWLESRNESPFWRDYKKAQEEIHKDNPGVNIDI